MTGASACFSQAATGLLSYFADSEQTLNLIARIAALGSAITACEFLALHREFEEGGFFDVRVQRLVIGSSALTRLKRTLLGLFGFRAISSLLVLQLALSVALALGLPSAFAGVCCLALAIVLFLLTLRGIDGFNGGDAMAKVLFLSSGLGLLGRATYREATLLFIAFQGCIAYLTPGLLRCLDGAWYDGSKLTSILRLRSFGRRGLWKMIQREPYIAALAGTGVALFEVTFPLWVLLPWPGVFIGLLAGVGFHLTNAAVMGLNTFVWSFVGAYPALVWLSVNYCWAG